MIPTQMNLFSIFSPEAKDLLFHVLYSKNALFLLQNLYICPQNTSSTKVGNNTLGSLSYFEMWMYFMYLNCHIVMSESVYKAI